MNLDKILGQYKFSLKEESIPCFSLKVFFEKNEIKANKLIFSQCAIKNNENNYSIWISFESTFHLFNFFEIYNQIEEFSQIQKKLHKKNNKDYYFSNKKINEDLLTIIDFCQEFEIELEIINENYKS